MWILFCVSTRSQLLVYMNFGVRTMLDYEASELDDKDPIQFKLPERYAGRHKHLRSIVL
jgi:hypothetical protein